MTTWPPLGYVTEGNFRISFADVVENIAPRLDDAPVFVVESAGRLMPSTPDEAVEVVVFPAIGISLWSRE